MDSRPALPVIVVEPFQEQAFKDLPKHADQRDRSYVGRRLRLCLVLDDQLHVRRVLRPGRRRLCQAHVVQPRQPGRKGRALESLYDPDIDPIRPTRFRGLLLSNLRNDLGKCDLIMSPRRARRRPNVVSFRRSCIAGLESFPHLLESVVPGLRGQQHAIAHIAGLRLPHQRMRARRRLVSGRIWRSLELCRASDRRFSQHLCCNLLAQANQAILQDVHVVLGRV